MKTTAEIDKSINQIRATGAKLDQLIQVTGVDVLEHFAQHKDTGVVNRLYLAMPKGARHTAMASWLLAHGALKANTDKGSKDSSPFAYDRDKVTDAEAAALDPWFDHKPSKAPDEVFDLQKAVRQLIIKAGKAPGLVHGDKSTLFALAKVVGIRDDDAIMPRQAAEVPAEPAKVGQE